MNQMAFLFPAGEPVTIDVIARLPDATSAINLAVHVSGKPPKQLYSELEIDKATWSRITNPGDNPAQFPHDKIVRFCEVVENDIFIQWLAWQRGKGLHLLESESQRLMRIKDEELARTRERLAYLESIVRGR